MKDIINESAITLGVCYYPEHWSDDLWESDFERMKALGFRYVRMAEFAWTIFEPSEGEFDFSLFDKAINLAGKYDLKVILGTPTATPPVWLTEKYPEVLNVSQGGITYRHGSRRHYNYNSDKYRKLSARIVTKMAKHYHNNKNVVGWQIDNEINCEISVFYSDADHEKFRQWLQEKYQSLDALNEAWGTVFWNQTYTDWNQVYLTRPTVNDSQNPHHALDEKRFISDSTIAFAKMQADIIRSYTKQQWVTTNGMFGHLDNHKLTQDILDFYAYDSYPNFNKIIEDTSVKPLQDRKWSLNLSTVRSLGGPFAIFEQQAGPGGWVNRIEQPTPKPGQLRLWTYQSLAHGADMILYFRWRTATKGSEIYWHGINDYHNLPNRRIAEIEQISQEIQKIGNDLIGASYEANVGILTDYDNEWDGEEDVWYGSFLSKSKEAWFKAFQYNHIPVDIYDLRETTTLEELAKYQVLVYPHAAILTEKTAALLEEYVVQGGKIVFGCRTGYKDKTGQPYMMAFPGYIKDLVGVTVEDYTLLNSLQPAPTVQLFGREKIEVHGFNEVLHKEKDDVAFLGYYGNAYYANKPALARRSHGKGSAYYFGGVFDFEVANAILEDLNVTDYRNEFDLTDSVELAVRKKKDKTYYLLLNFVDSKQHVYLKRSMRDLISGKQLSGEIEIDGYDVFILE
ncbi:beta-galactosidase [Gracilibacillus caseinilyticus]|uniref:Beta-galactosidase n=1 Tax=Gracilibacillus caseinilyticus TaxID=2932256 RepID=A0ABY4F0D3_9BACI|nr:beta-galactosidase [Gracilibacillus caseinilyticus]UOQ49954.1 beta-galactosidase [Gracilibacillus caseinilyticus]